MKKPHLSVQYKKELELGCVLPNQFDIISKVGNYDDVKVINTIKFQEGSVEEFGINGITEESLLSVLLIRFEELLQKSPLSCEKYKLSLELVNTLLQLLTKTDENYLIQNNISKTTLNLLLEKRKEIKEEILTRKITPKQRFINLIDEAIKRNINRIMIIIQQIDNYDCEPIHNYYGSMNNNCFSDKLRYKLIGIETDGFNTLKNDIIENFDDELVHKIFSKTLISRFCYSNYIDNEFNENICKLLNFRPYKLYNSPKKCLLDYIKYSVSILRKYIGYIIEDYKKEVRLIMIDNFYVQDIEFIKSRFNDELNNKKETHSIIGFYSSDDIDEFNNMIEIMKKSRFY